VFRYVCRRSHTRTEGKPDGSLGRKAIPSWGQKLAISAMVDSYPGSLFWAIVLYNVTVATEKLAASVPIPLTVPISFSWRAAAEILS
jgi:hypothetical protein